MAALTDHVVMSAAFRCGRRWLYALLLLGSLAHGSQAQNEVVPIAPSDPSTNRIPFDMGEFVDRHHKSLSGRVIDFGHSMDAWLSKSVRHPEPQPENGKDDRLLNPRQGEDGSDSRVKISPTLKLRDGDGMEVSLKIRARLNLPRFEKRLALVFSNLDDDNALFDDDLRTPSFSGSDQQGTASLRYFFKETLNFKASADAGLRFRPEPDPKLRLRLRLRQDFESFTTRFTQTFFWEGQDGFGEKSQFDLEQQKRLHYLRRLSTIILWAEDSDGVEASQTLAYYHFISKRRAAGGRLSVSGVLEPSARMENYGAYLVYRQRLHRDWIYMELEPGVEFPRTRDFHATGLINLKFDILIGDWEAAVTAQP